METMEQYDIFLINLDPTIGHEIKKIGKLNAKKIGEVKKVLQEILPLITYSSIVISTRRFSRRPSSLALSPRGLVPPQPL